MSRRHRLTRCSLLGGHLAAASALLYWYGGSSFFCSRAGPLRSTFVLAIGCTIWDFFARTVSSWLAIKIMKVRSAAPLLAAGFTGVGLASIPFWIYRGYGHWFFEGTWIDVSCFFTEGFGLMFPVVVAPALAIVNLVHAAVLLRASNGSPSHA